MPGIVGLITKMPREWAEPQLQRMVKSLCHEPFYVSGVWIDESLGVYVGWAERRGSFCEGMPLSNEQGDVQLIFSGEEFPDPGVARRLKEKGHNIGPKGPSYLVHLYEEDPKFPKSLNGRFQGLLADRTRETATLFNDRYGMNRVYYHESKEAFYFAAEAKAILGVRPELRKADPKSMGEFVACGCVLENRTLFEGIQVLPPGSAWVFRGGAPDKKNVYFHEREWEEQSPLELEAYYQKLREVFSANVPRYFNGSQPVAMSLTGGLDSRMILAWQKPSPQSVPCYSFGGPFRESQDVLLARRVAGACKQSHKVIPVGSDFLTQFSRYAERTVYLTDGCLELGHSPDLYVNELAREIAPVRVTGNYGGEVLRRVRAFKPVPPVEGLFRPEFLTYVQGCWSTYESLVRTNPLTFAVFRQAPWHHYSLLALEETQLSLRSPFLDNDFIQTVFRAPESASLSNDVCLRLIAEGNPSLLQIRTDRGLAGNHGSPSREISRCLLDFTFKAEYAYDHGMPQWVAQIDHLLSPLHLERLFLGRHKFYHFRIWYRDALSKYVQEMLLDPRTLSRPYLERSCLETIVRSHLKGNRNYTNAIHKLLTLELTHRLFLDSR
jgi:asparagine synthase (glutamine-hydrolysing)